MLCGKQNFWLALATPLLCQNLEWAEVFSGTGRRCSTDAGPLPGGSLHFLTVFVLRPPMHNSLRQTWVMLLATCLLLVHGLASSAQESWKTQIAELLAEPVYRNAHWGLLFVDLQSAKSYTSTINTSSLCRRWWLSSFPLPPLDGLGAEYRFHTPIFARGEIDAQGKLTGDLILRASGDPTLGGRTTDKVCSPLPTPITPMPTGAANRGSRRRIRSRLNDLARQVHASGIRSIDGEVLIGIPLVRNG